MANPESRKTETMVGLFVVLGLAVISVLVFAIAGKQKLFEPRYRLFAMFSQVSGLKVGSPVRLAGLEVGSVESLDFTGNGKVVAVLAIQMRYQEQIRNDSVATISSVGILGDKSVEVSIGDKEEPVHRAGTMIKTKDPFDVAAFVDQAAPMAAKIDEILTYLSKITSEFSMENLQLADTMEHANSILKKVDKGVGSFGSAINDPTLYRELTGLARAGKETSVKLQVALEKVESASGNLPELIASTHRAMEDISAISGKIRKSAEKLPDITERISEAAENVQSASRDLPAIAGSFRRAAGGAEDVVEAAGKTWFIRRNLPKPPTEEERIILDSMPFSYEETRP